MMYSFSDIIINLLKIFLVGLFAYCGLWRSDEGEEGYAVIITKTVVVLVLSLIVLTPMSCSGGLSSIEEKLAKCVQILEERSDE